MFDTYITLNTIIYFFSLAFTYLKDYSKAVSCYKKACELDPENSGYRRNYQLTLNNLNEGNEPSVEIPSDDTATETPNLMETAARLMTDPDVSSVFVIFELL